MFFMIYQYNMTSYLIFFGYMLDIKNVIGEITYLDNNFKNEKHDYKSKRLEIE